MLQRDGRPCKVWIKWLDDLWPQPFEGVVDVEFPSTFDEALVSVGAYLPDEAGLTDNYLAFIVRIDPPPGNVDRSWDIDVWSFEQDIGWIVSFGWSSSDMESVDDEDFTSHLDALADGIWGRDPDEVLQALSHLRGGNIEVSVET